MLLPIVVLEDDAKRRRTVRRLPPSEQIVRARHGPPSGRTRGSSLRS